MRVGQPELITLAASVDAALLHAGWAIDDKPLRAHLTLARADWVAAGAVIGARLSVEPPTCM